MARSVSAVLVLGFLVVTAFCMAEASAALKPKDGLANLDALVKVTVHNKCSRDVRLVVVGAVNGKVLDCKKGALAVLGPVKARLEVLNLLKVELFVFNSKGELLKVKTVVNIKLSFLGKLVKDVTELVLDVVEGAKGDTLKLLCGKAVLAEDKNRSSRFS